MEVIRVQIHAEDYFFFSVVAMYYHLFIIYLCQFPAYASFKTTLFMFVEKFLADNILSLIHY